MRDCIRLIYGEVPRVAHLEFLIRMVLAVPEKDIMSCNGSLNGRGIGEAKASAAGPPPEYATAGYLYGIHDQHRHEFDQNPLIDTTPWMPNEWDNGLLCFSILRPMNRKRMP